jgi:hypothetical protein
MDPVSRLSISDLDVTMGNSTPAPEEPPIKDDVYKWLGKLYMEMRDMAVVSFLIFGYDSEVTHKVGLQGLNLTDDGKILKSGTRDLPRSFKPQEVLKLLETNRETLEVRFPKE